MTDQLYDDIQLVRELEGIESGLTAWEMEFIESVSRQVEHRPLSDRQREICERIAEEKG